MPKVALLSRMPMHDNHHHNEHHFQDVSEKRIPIMLCANKVDLRGDATAQGRRCITADEGEKMARQHSAIFIETSAKEGNNVMDALVQLSR